MFFATGFCKRSSQSPQDTIMKIFRELLLGVLLVTPAATLAADDPNPYSGLKWRNIGPAFMSGRIADIDWDPTDDSVWYVGVGSGGVWKTINAGTTWTPIFDGQSSYSIGNVTVDPSNPHRVWVGTGEDVGGRHVAFGDGIYLSEDGGQTWENKGLKQSQHISTIVVHPTDSNTVWVAVQGPLWDKGGERGLYMTTDGGETWNKTLGGGEWTGVTDIVIDPRNPRSVVRGQPGSTIEPLPPTWVAAPRAAFTSRPTAV
jgi:photosystem II stability/assembly factor-like uncharacterized protein